MTTKLTLTVKKSIIDRAKSYAKNTDRSLSENRNLSSDNYGRKLLH